MARLIIIVFSFSLWSHLLFGQNCQFVEKIRARIDRSIDNKNSDSVVFYINQIPKNEQICYQEYLVYKLHYLINIKRLDSVAILFENLNKSISKSSNQYIKLQQIYLSGRYFYSRGLNDSASYYFIKSLDQAKYQKDTLFQIKSLNSLSNVFANLTQYDKAIKYGNAGLVLARKKKDKPSEILLLGNLISYYGKQFLETNEKIFLDSAESVSKQLVIESKKQNNIYALLKAYSGLGSCYFQYEEYKKTLAYSDSIIQLARDGKYSKVVLQAYGNICDSYLALGKFELAKRAADSSLSYALKQGDKMAISEIYYKLYDCEYELKNYQRAIEYYEMHTAVKDSANAEEQFSVVNELEQKYNKFENEKIIGDLTKEKEISGLRIRILVIGIISFVILIVLIVFVYRQRSLKQKHVLLEIEQRLNRSRINPHFFFNSITTLQGIALKENDGKKVYKNLFTFSKLMRETLESTYADLVPIEKEVSFLMNYVELQKLNQKDKFNFEVVISSEIDHETVFIPSMIIQPFVENSIEHGFSEMSTGGSIKLDFSIYDDELHVTITDNGKGIKMNNVKQKDHISRAMQITTDRLNLINNLHNTNARFLVDSNTLIGTVVEIFLPLGLKDESSGN